MPPLKGTNASKVLAALASEQKLWPSRTTAWDACTSQVQRGQAQGVAGAITTNQLTLV